MPTAAADFVAFSVLLVVLAAIFLGISLASRDPTTKNFTGGIAVVLMLIPIVMLLVGQTRHKEAEAVASNNTRAEEAFCKSSLPFVLVPSKGTSAITLRLSIDETFAAKNFGTYATYEVISGNLINPVVCGSSRVRYIEQVLPGQSLAPTMRSELCKDATVSSTVAPLPTSETDQPFDLRIGESWQEFTPPAAGVYGQTNLVRPSVRMSAVPAGQLLLQDDTAIIRTGSGVVYRPSACEHLPDRLSKLLATAFPLP